MSAGTPTPAGRGESFDDVILPHLEAGVRLARWLMRDQHDAEDVAQEACLRAFRYFRTFAGGDARAWFLTIVRNTSYGWHRHKYKDRVDAFDEEQHSTGGPAHADPETLLLQTDDAATILRAMSRLSAPFHQLLVLREIEGLTYQELAEVVGIPVGTVMSRLSRARVALRRSLRSEPRTTRNSSKAPGREREPDAVLV